MSTFIDIKYLNLLSTKLTKFKRKSDNLFNFRCPHCGDSKKSSSKARGFVYRKKNDMFFKCHNCGIGQSLGNLIKFLDPSMHKEYTFERFKEGKPQKEKLDFDFTPSKLLKTKTYADKALDQLINDIEKGINKDAKFVVFHDAYQYFEERFETRAAGALTLNTDVLPGAKQIADIQDVIKDKGIKCIFSEPQFNPKIITTIAEDMNIKTGVFDPLGANIDSNKDLYFKLIQNLGNELKGC